MGISKLKLILARGRQDTVLITQLEPAKEDGF